jgi:hypothetical protein
MYEQINDDRFCKDVIFNSQPKQLDMPNASAY